MRALKTGDRVRLRGHANMGGESLIVEGQRAEVIGKSPGYRLRVKLLRPDEYGAYECDVYPSQCRRLIPKRKPAESVTRRSLLAAINKHYALVTDSPKKFQDFCEELGL